MMLGVGRTDDGVIYAVTEGGDLVATRAEPGDGTGEDTPPEVVARRGWDHFSVVLGGDATFASATLAIDAPTTRKR